MDICYSIMIITNTLDFVNLHNDHIIKRSLLCYTDYLLGNISLL
jgi:hypothetical protein